MPSHGRTKLVPPNTEPENRVLEVLEESRELEQKEEPVLTELDMEIECPRCHKTMDLQSSFDKLMYTSDGCSFLLKCVQLIKDTECIPPAIVYAIQLLFPSKPSSSSAGCCCSSPSDD